MPRQHTGQLVEREFLTLAVWDQLDRDTCEQVARAVEKCLPEPWKFKEIAWHECGGQKRFVAFYTWKKPGRYQEATFALIPGGEVELGYDPKYPHQISTQLIEEWEEAAAKNNLPVTNWGRALETCLSELRTVNLLPYLIEQKTTPESAKSWCRGTETNSHAR